LGTKRIGVVVEDDAVLAQRLDAVRVDVDVLGKFGRQRILPQRQLPQQMAAEGVAFF
jgi:hypothetical protein